MQAQRYNFGNCEFNITCQVSLEILRFHVLPYKASVVAALKEICNDEPVSLQVARSGDGYGSLTACGKSCLTC